MEISEERLEKFRELSSSLSGFEDEEELIEYILDAAVEEIENQSGSVHQKNIDENTVENRLEDLGYLG
ncbi:hypothetical protein NDI54_10025 [Haloarcula sp. S1AR25-5A]|uniref:Uncharacterized protein n=1 Tax=Haloarcula terrestris TaxID=2950533 RepID=A0AAE4EX16_9EURY|nr:hypothetical protein [Haloarcula terrestris]MDS0221685.1 hypothetical protein [Haloarcula terrestris]